MENREAGRYDRNISKHSAMCTCEKCVRRRLKEMKKSPEYFPEYVHIKKKPKKPSYFMIYIGVFLILLALWGIAVYGGQPLDYLGPKTSEYFKNGVDKITAWAEGTSNESIQSRVNELYILTNKERVKQNLMELKRDPQLEIMAQKHAEDMYKIKSVDHEGFNNRSDIAMTRGYNTTAENVAGGGFEALSFLEMWMKSPGHKANILDPELTYIGIGIYGKYAVQFFAGY